MLFAPDVEIKLRSRSPIRKPDFDTEKVYANHIKRYCSVVLNNLLEKKQGSSRPLPPLLGMKVEMCVFLTNGFFELPFSIEDNIKPIDLFKQTA